MRPSWLRGITVGERRLDSPRFEGSNLCSAHGLTGFTPFGAACMMRMLVPRMHEAKTEYYTLGFGEHYRSMP